MTQPYKQSTGTTIELLTLRWAKACLCIAMMLTPTIVVSADSDNHAAYFAIRLGGGWYTDDESLPGIRLENPSQFPFPHFAFGKNINDHWGVELDIDYIETNVQVLGLTGPGSSPRLGEYATWNVLGQVRYRYAMYKGRFVPYLIGGLGVGIGEFNDRNRNFESFAFDGPLETTFIGAFGGGIEYYVTPNMAIDIEAKYVGGFETDVKLNGVKQDMNLEHILLSGGLRIYFTDEHPAFAAPVGAPKDSSERPAYIVLRTGGSLFLNADKAAPTINIADDVVLLDWSAAVGYNISRNWGVELAAEMYETTLSSPGFGNVAEYSVWNILGLIRWRYPMMADRFVPYLIGGGGVAYSNVNDPRKPYTQFPINVNTESGAVFSAGGGGDYFFAENVSMNVELRYVDSFNTKVDVGADSFKLDDSVLFLGAGLRIHF